jgi:hypothetical protein
MTERRKRYDEQFNPPTQEDEDKLSAVLEIVGKLFDVLLTERQQALLLERYPRMRHDLTDIAWMSRRSSATRVRGARKEP